MRGVWYGIWVKLLAKEECMGYVLGRLVGWTCDGGGGRSGGVRGGGQGLGWVRGGLGLV